MLLGGSRLLCTRSQVLLIATDSCDTWEDLAFHVLEHSATASRYVRYLVGELVLVDSCNRVATTNEGECTILLSCLGNSLSNCGGTLSELVELEYAHRTIPDHSLALADYVREESNGLVGDVKTHPAFGGLIDLRGVGVGILVELVSVYTVNGEEYLYALSLSLVEDLLSQVEFVGLAERSTNLTAQSLDEGVGHATTNDQVVYTTQEVLDDVDLVANLGTTHDGGEGTLCVVEHFVHGLELLVDEETEHLGILCEEVGDNGR